MRLEYDNKLVYPVSNILIPTINQDMYICQLAIVVPESEDSGHQSDNHGSQCSVDSYPRLNHF